MTPLEADTVPYAWPWSGMGVFHSTLPLMASMPRNEPYCHTVPLSSVSLKF